MIYSVAESPVFDYSFPGKGYCGRGTDCGVVMHRMGADVAALGILENEISKTVRNNLCKEGVHCAMVNINETAREYLGFCGDVFHGGTSFYRNSLLDAMGQIKRGDFAVLSGRGDISEFAKVLYSAKIPYSVDVSAENLFDTLRYRPFTVRVNQRGLKKLFCRMNICDCALEICRRGAAFALVTMGKEGTVMANAYGKVRYMPALPVDFKNNTGCADSLTAGFILSLLGGKSESASFRFAAASGACAAACDSLPELDDINRIYYDNPAAARVLK